MIEGIRWLSTHPGSGFGDATEAYLTSLSDRGIPVTWTLLGWPSDVWQAPYGPLRNPETASHRHHDLVGLGIPHDIVVVHSSPLWHDALREEAAGRKLVAFTAWETDHVAAETVAILDRYDLVLVPSQFNVEVLQSSGVSVPVRAVPHVAQPFARRSMDALEVSSERVPGDDSRFTFYVIATWTTRKAIGDTVTAYLDAFTGRDDVHLIIHTTPQDHVARRRQEEGGTAIPVHSESWYSLARMLGGRKDLPAITLQTRTLDRAGIEALHGKGDCYVSLSRGEGWGLGASDAAAAGNVVIATGWGGTPDLLPEDYPFLVDFALHPAMETEADAWWAPSDGECWAKADLAHAAELMRSVYEDRSYAKSWGTQLASHVRTRYAPASVINALLSALED